MICPTTPKPSVLGVLIWFGLVWFGCDAGMHVQGVLQFAVGLRMTFNS